MVDTTVLVFAAIAGAVALGAAAIGAGGNPGGMGCLPADLPPTSLVQTNSQDDFFNALKDGNRCDGGADVLVDQGAPVIVRPAPGGSVGAGGNGGGDGISY